MAYNLAPCTHPYRNPALQRCCEARNRAMRQVTEAEIDRLSLNPYYVQNSSRATPRDVDSSTVFSAGSNAFLAQLPELDSLDNVRDYAACIAHAMALDVIDPTHGPKLLYAAQVILSSYRTQAKAVAQDASRSPEVVA